MLIKLFYLAVLAVVGAAAQADPPVQPDPSDQPQPPCPTDPASPTDPAGGKGNGTLTCGAPPPDEEFMAAAKELAKQEEHAKRQDATEEPITIDTYIHLVLPSNWDSIEQLKLLLQGFNPFSSILGQNTPVRRRVRGQVDRLNKDFASSNIKFKLIGSNVTFNDQWTESVDEAVMQRTLRQGDYKTLNLYFVETVAGSVLLEPVSGVCTYPRAVNNGAPTSYGTDGCIIRVDELSTRTTTHEVGHWLGLLHTFANRCHDGGDQVDDTAPHKTSTDFCFPWARTCDGGQDERLVKNYMNIVPESCAKEFTPGQSTRMRSMWNHFRAPR